MAAARKRNANVDPEYRLIGRIHSTSFSYFIAGHHTEGHQFLDDEAIINLSTTVVKMQPPNADHLGAELECSLVCARRFDESSPKSGAGGTFFLPVTLKRNQRSVLAYLPSDAFWALQSRLEAGSVTHVELSYVKPIRGAGELTSIHLRSGE
ncbi:hypothetical protein [Bradyrhizobium sp. cf659]|uniref:hypothetical protein n=1 Tax=Bradyrhizobium sp. cf659 TaxID=1761771 RepID=UPI0011606D38|nr:hypothetical protein [Bradyrhizobium sp. cf659]